MALNRRSHNGRFVYLAVLALTRALGGLPLPLGQALGRVLGAAAARIPFERSRVVRDNLARVFGATLTPERLERLHRQVFMHFGQMLFEVPLALRLNPGNLGDYFSFENEAAMRTALEQGRGVLALTAHLGNWELLAPAVHLRLGAATAAVVRPVDYPPADRFLRHLRGRFGAQLISKQRGMAGVLRALRANRMTGLLLDQNVDWYEGVFAPFLGHPACTNKGLALIARKTGAPVVPAFCVRRPDGRFHVIVGDPLPVETTGDKTRDVEILTLLCNRTIEKYIRQYPEQWFWFHRRWKTQPYCAWPPPVGG